MNRRSVLKTFTALILAPIGRAIGYCRVPRAIVNGVSLELPKQINIRIEVDPAGAEIEFINLEVVGGLLTIRNPLANGIHIICKDGGRVVVEGKNCAIFVENKNKSEGLFVDNQEPAILLRPINFENQIIRDYIGNPIP